MGPQYGNRPAGPMVRGPYGPWESSSLDMNQPTSMECHMGEGIIAEVKVSFSRDPYNYGLLQSQKKTAVGFHPPL